MTTPWRFTRWAFAALMAVVCFGLCVLTFRSFFVFDEFRISHRSPLPQRVDPDGDYYLRDWFYLYTSRGGLLLLNSANVWKIDEDGVPPVWAMVHESVPMQQMPPGEAVYLTSDLVFEDGAGDKLYGFNWLGYAVAPADGGPDDVPGFTPHRSRAVVVPLPLLVVLTGIVPFVWLRSHLRRRSSSRRGFEVGPGGTDDGSDPAAPTQAG